jgi:hypothetical protein
MSIARGSGITSAIGLMFVLPVRAVVIVGTGGYLFRTRNA